MTTRLVAKSHPRSYAVSCLRRYARAVQPVVGVGGDPTLDVDERVAQLHAHLARPAVADGPRPTRRLDGAHGCDHGGGAAREDLGEAAVRATGLPLLDADLSF